MRGGEGRDVRGGRGGEEGVVAGVACCWDYGFEL